MDVSRTLREVVTEVFGECTREMLAIAEDTFEDEMQHARHLRAITGHTVPLDRAAVLTKTCQVIRTW